MKEPENPDYKNLLDLLAIVTECENRLGSIDADIQSEYLELVDAVKEDYIALQSKKAEAEQAVEILAKRNPQWFEDEKTIKSPFGQVRSTATSAISVPSLEAALRLVKLAGREAEFIRTREELDLNALDRLKDEELALFGLVRQRAESLTIKPARVDLGKTLKAAEKAAKKKAVAV
jgi:phage host-nuclease inhibitor protein Gam